MYWAIPALLTYEAITILVHISINLIDATSELARFESFAYFLFGKIQDSVFAFYFLVLDMILKFLIVYLFYRKYRFAISLSLVLSSYWLVNAVFPSILIGSYYNLIPVTLVVIFSSILFVRKKVKVIQNEN